MQSTSNSYSKVASKSIPGLKEYTFPFIRFKEFERISLTLCLWPTGLVDVIGTMLQISSRVSIPLQEIQLQAIRSQGAGGQNVNKVSTAVHLFFDIRASSLPEIYKERLLNKKDRRISHGGHCDYQITGSTHSGDQPRKSTRPVEGFDQGSNAGSQIPPGNFSNTGIQRTPSAG